MGGYFFADVTHNITFFVVLIPSRYLAKADCRAKPGGAYFLSVGDTVFSPPTTDARLTIQFISLPTFHLEGRRILVFLIKLSSFLKQIFHIYHFLEEKHFYKKNLVVETLSQIDQERKITGQSIRNHHLWILKYNHISE